MTTIPTLPEPVRRWALDNVIDRRIELRHIHWSDMEAFPPGQIRQLRLTDDDGFFDAIREIPELSIVWRYAGMFRSRFPLDNVTTCNFHEAQLLFIHGPMEPKVERHLVCLKRHLFHFQDGHEVAYHIGQCPECRAVHWGEEQP